MKQLLVAEMNRALELIDSIEQKEIEHKEKLEENKKREKETGYWIYTPDITFKDKAELKKLLKMIRLHSVAYEKEIKR